MDNTAPIFSNLGQPVAYTQGSHPYVVPTLEQGPVILDADVTVFDAELSAWDDFNGASIRIHREGGANADDHFYSLAPWLHNFDDISIRSVTNANGELEIVFNELASQGRVDMILQHIGYTNASREPEAQVNLVWEFRDGNGGGQGEGGQLMGTGVTPVNITPSEYPQWIDERLPWRPDYDVAADDLRQLLAQEIGPARTFYYSFPDAPPPYKGAQYAETFVALTLAQRESVKTALAYVSTIINVHFEETANPELLNALSFDARVVAGTAGGGSTTLPSASAAGSDVTFITGGAADLSDAHWTPIVLHEIARALGLPELSPTATFADLDIAALQAVYGPAYDGPSWDDVHTLSALTPNFIWDGSGPSTLSAAGLSQPVTLHIEPGHWDFIGSQGELITSPGQVTVNPGTWILGLEGGSGDDVLVGWVYWETLVGNDGNDSIEGAGGYDTLQGQAGNDTLDGGTGSDELAGGAGDDSLRGGQQDDHLTGGIGNDRLEGGEGRDRLDGGAGHDRIDGGAGPDLAYFLMTRDDYLLSTPGAAFTVTSLTDSSDTDDLVSIERVEFADQSLAFDLDGNAGKVAEIVGAVFGARWINDPVYIRVGLALADNGYAFDDMSAYALEVKFKHLTPSNAELVTVLYANVLGEAPDNVALAYYVGLLENGTFTQTTLTSYAAQTSENDLHIDLAGLALSGLEYSPY